MSKFQRGLVLTVMSLIIGVFSASAADFYETQLRLGEEAYRTGRLPDAIDYLRIANFGLLDRPVMLVEGLARLALAQHAAGREEDVTKTIDRFVSVERQFPSWTTAKSKIDPSLTGDFERLLVQRLSPETIATVASLATIVPTEQERLEAMTPDQRMRYYEGKARSEPTNARWSLQIAQEEARAGDTRKALRWSEKALDIDPELTEARILRLRVLTSREEYGRAAEELRLLPEQAWYDQPEITADAFVIYTKTNLFENADLLYDRIPADLIERADVAEAMTAFRRREASRLEEQAMREPLADEAPVDGQVVSEAVPDASPVEGPDEPVTTRMNTPRGSFTTPPDPIAESLTVAKRMIGEGRPGDAQLVLRDALRKDPGSRELRLAMLEASCLGGDWRTGISQLLLIEPFKKGEEKFMFYGAVVYYESDKLEDAKELMAAALPKLARNAYVDHYARLVSGE